jgi:predicted phosphohydrolase
LASETGANKRVRNDESAYYKEKLHAKAAVRKPVHQYIVMCRYQVSAFGNSERTLTKMLKNNWKDR